MKYYMKQTIEIEVPDGKKAVWKDNKIVFEDIKPQLPKTWEEFCDKHINNEYYISECSSIERLALGHIYKASLDKNLLPSIEAAKAHLALMQLHQLRDCYRQGWIPNWYDDYDKWCIERSFNYDTNRIKIKVAWGINVPYFLSFQTEELATEFLNNFRELIEQAGDLI